MDVKTLFDNAENGTLTYEQFQEACKVNNANFTDLSEGNYVSKNKYDNEIATKDQQIATLNTTIGTRDTDLATLKSQLESAGTDKGELKKLNEQFSTLQNQYNQDMEKYKNQLASQSYEFAVKEFANTKKFTSNAAKRDFVASMINKNLQMENNKILGAEDFVAMYSAENSDAFVVENPQPATPQPQPQFVAPAQGNSQGQPSGFQFNFTGVRAHE